MSLLIVILLAVIQGAAELLPVSSSAHVIVAEKLLSLNPTSPEMMFLLVMLHTGTMGAVLVYFATRWRARFQAEGFAHFAKMAILATVTTGILGLGLQKIIEHIVHGEVETIFGNLKLISASLLCAGVIILAASRHEGNGERGPEQDPGSQHLDSANSFKIGLIQGLCLPFRGFSRSGATISVGMLGGLNRNLSEDFSFALAVVLTPVVIAREGLRLLKAAHATGAPLQLGSLLGPGLVGMVCSFVAGLLALKLLSDWLENGRWKFFGYYCLVAAVAVFVISLNVA
jgi:undecaprenyl-diphosphatase